jgi:hypothetical protein
MRVFHYVLSFVLAVLRVNSVIELESISKLVTGRLWVASLKIVDYTIT